MSKEESDINLDEFLDAPLMLSDSELEVDVSQEEIPAETEAEAADQQAEPESQPVADEQPEHQAEPASEPVQPEINKDLQAVQQEMSNLKALFQKAVLDGDQSAAKKATQTQQRLLEKIDQLKKSNDGFLEQEQATHLIAQEVDSLKDQSQQDYERQERQRQEAEAFQRRLEEVEFNQQNPNLTGQYGDLLSEAQAIVNDKYYETMKNMVNQGHMTTEGAKQFLQQQDKAELQALAKARATPTSTPEVKETPKPKATAPIKKASRPQTEKTELTLDDWLNMELDFS